MEAQHCNIPQLPGRQTHVDSVTVSVCEFVRLNESTTLVYLCYKHKLVTKM